MKNIVSVVCLSALMICAQGASAKVSAEVNEYCQGMGQGLAEDDAREMIAQCIEEQTGLSDEGAVQYEEEPVGLDCYQEADEVIRQDPDADYDGLVQDCLNQHS